MYGTKRGSGSERGIGAGAAGGGGCVCAGTGAGAGIRAGEPDGSGDAANPVACLIVRLPKWPSNQLR